MRPVSRTPCGEKWRSRVLWSMFISEAHWPWPTICFPIGHLQNMRRWIDDGLSNWNGSLMTRFRRRIWTSVRPYVSSKYSDYLKTLFKNLVKNIGPEKRVTKAMITNMLMNQVHRDRKSNHSCQRHRIVMTRYPREILWEDAHFNSIVSIRFRFCKHKCSGISQIWHLSRM